MNFNYEDFIKKHGDTALEKAKEAVIKGKDMVNHPPHYEWLKEKCGVEVIDIAQELSFNLGNTIKYILRAGKKEDASQSALSKTIEDLEKAEFYIKAEIKRLKNYGN